jgi:hypothetical protein
MANHLMTFEGFYDGKAIHAFGKIKTRKKHRVLITFLEEVDDFADLKKHSEKIFAKLWKDEDDALWNSYL